jgi:hypothetical protein
MSANDEELKRRLEALNKDLSELVRLLDEAETADERSAFEDALRPRFENCVAA